jgi:hypothetical protein
MAGLTAAKNGNFFGCTSSDANDNAGSIFRVNATRKWKLDLLFSFAGPPDAAYPSGDLVLDNGGNVYGTAQGGGSGQACVGGCGAVFELRP